MGRSVSTPPEATIVAYAQHSDDETEFDMVIDDYRDHLRFLFPSVVTISAWVGYEERVVGENGHAAFGISEYRGLVAYWAIPKTKLGAHWLAQVEPRFAAAFGTLTRLGTASNGETFFQRSN